LREVVYEYEKAKLIKLTENAERQAIERGFLILRWKILQLHFTYALYPITDEAPRYELWIIQMQAYIVLWFFLILEEMII